MARFNVAENAPPGGWPGSGGQPGPRKMSIEARELCDQLVHDKQYQAKLRADFKARKVHPTIEALVWAYGCGKPTERIDIKATLGVTAIVEHRRALAALPLEVLEPILATIEGEMARVTQLTEPQGVVVQADLPIVSAKTLTNQAGSDNSSYDNQPEPSAGNDASLTVPTSSPLIAPPEPDGDVNT